MSSESESAGQVLMNEITPTRIQSYLADLHHVLNSNCEISPDPQEYPTSSRNESNQSRPAESSALNPVSKDLGDSDHFCSPYCMSRLVAGHLIRNSSFLLVKRSYQHHGKQDDSNNHLRDAAFEGIAP